jgi:hypothetical protein
VGLEKKKRNENCNKKKTMKLRKMGEKCQKNPKVSALRWWCVDESMIQQR